MGQVGSERYGNARMGIGTATDRWFRASVHVSVAETGSRGAVTGDGLAVEELSIAT
jgi:hypothetical protein